MLTPSERDFELLAGRDFDIIPVCREIPGDLETPVGAFLKIGRGDYAFLLESDDLDSPSGDCRHSDRIFALIFRLR